MNRLQLALIDAVVRCACCAADRSFALSRATARVDSTGRPACERCGRRLADVKHHRAYGAGRACAPRCKGTKRSSEERTVSAEPAKKKHRRTKSDPGQLQDQARSITSTRLRVRAPKPPPPAPKPRVSMPPMPAIDPIALLDAAHARRMALIEAENREQSSAVVNTSAVLWQ